MRADVARNRPGRRIGYHHFAVFRGHLDGLGLDTLGDRYLETGTDVRHARRTLRWVRDELIAAARRLDIPLRLVSSDEIRQSPRAFARSDFVQDKVNFIRGIHLEDIPEEKPSINDREKRREIIEAKFRRKRFTLDDVLAHLASTMDGEIDNRTVRRDLGALGGHPLTKPKGTWSMK